MKRLGATKSRINYVKPNDDKVVISSEYFEDDRACLSVQYVIEH